MLDEYYKLYKERADLVPGWKTESKNNLVHKYIEYEKEEPFIAENYLCAIICRYWYNINIYYMKSYKSVPIEECYEWLIHAILYALEHRRWLDTDSTVYNDPNGPDKVINRCIATTRNIFYQASNNDNKKVNYNIDHSIDAVEFLSEDEEYSEDAIEEHLNLNHYNSFIKKLFENRDYIEALTLDSIINYDVFQRNESNNYFSKTKLLKHLRSLDDKFCKDFSKRFALDENRVELAKNYCSSLSYQMLNYYVTVGLAKLKKKYLKGEL